MYSGVFNNGTHAVVRSLLLKPHPQPETSSLYRNIVQQCLVPRPKTEVGEYIGIWFGEDMCWRIQQLLDCGVHSIMLSPYPCLVYNNGLQIRPRGQLAQTRGYRATLYVTFNTIYFYNCARNKYIKTTRYQNHRN